MPFKKFSVDQLKSELQPSALKSRAQGLNDRFSRAPTGSSNYRASSTATRPVASTAPPPPAPAPASRPTPPPRSTGAPPPAPPRRTGAPPPPPARKPSGAAWEAQEQHQVYEETPVSHNIDWQNISAADKQALFGVFDRFFQNGSAPRTALRADANAHIVAPPQASAPKPTQVQVQANDGPPPPPLWARPSSSQVPTTSSGMSYPPATQTASQAQDLALYFTSSTQWTAPWFTSDSPIPPPLEGRTDMTWTASWQQMGNQKVLIGAAMFCDLSIAWWRVEWDASRERAPGFANSVRREAKHTERPSPFGAEQLWEACSAYGEQVAAFAEAAEQRGVSIAHGECWDLASEALASVQGLDPPVPSIGRTHGHLIFSGSSSGKNYRTDQKGTWHGGDTAVRRGDIVEWRKVRVGKPDGTGWADLGAPDHTAVIVQTYMTDEAGANTQPTDGESVPPWMVGALEVIEQSKGKPPTRAVYELSHMQSGEVWIYRPVSMLAYIGIDALKADWEQTPSSGNVKYVR